jgi:CRISPR-associated exonuclease Cas4
MSSPAPVGIEERPEEEPEPILISALQHWSYCPRQCGLIHLEQTYSENLYTTRGRHAHSRVDRPGNEARRGARIERALPLWSRRLGLVGKADTVEFVGGVPYPVEYKVGARKAGGHDEVQLAAQALCLEEMLGVPVPRGALYYHAARARHEVVIDEALRRRVEETVAAIRAMLAGGTLPPAPNDSRCPRCSLIDSCLPGVVGGGGLGDRHLRALFAVADE